MMAQNIILPDGPLFMVDRGWKNPHKDFALQIVPFSGSKKPQISRRSPQHDSGATILNKLTLEPTAFQRDAERTESAHKTKATSFSDQSFQFVNATASFRDRDPEMRKLIRSHVMKGSRRTQRPRRKPNTERTSHLIKAEEPLPAQKGNGPETDISTSAELGPTLSGSATSFYGVLPCLMKPHFYSLLNYCM